jgi:heat shock protein HslJ
MPAEIFRARRRARFVAALAAAWAACACSVPQASDNSVASGTVQEDGSSPVEKPTLYGEWRIVEVNGAPARGRGSGTGGPSVSFEPSRYGGSSGCNQFGGNGLLVGERWFAEPPMATAIGCSDLEAQERGIYSIVAGGPQVEWEGRDTVVLRTTAGRLRLQRSGPLRELEPDRPPMWLAGTSWYLFSVDGATLELPGARQPVRLSFEADRYRLETPCGTRSGNWRQSEGMVVTEPPGASEARNCAKGARRQSDSAAEAATGSLKYVTGVNGEFVLTNGEHWVVGRRDLTSAREDPHLLSGQWRVASVDGVAPPAGERPAELAFGPGGYAVWDGCMHSEGVAIAYRRKLFTRGSGMSTLANCPADEIRFKINRVVGSRPRIGLTEDGGVALISPAGTLRLQRKSRRAFGLGIETFLRAGSTFDLLTSSTSDARLTVGPGNRFSLALACGTMSGSWRSDRGAGGTHARFGPDRPPEGCDNDPVARRLFNFFAGDVLSAVGPNKDIALFVSGEEGLPARVASGRP